MDLNENWVILCLGVLLVFFGFVLTHVRGPMPGSKPGYPMPLRTRLILISFGVLMFVLGVVRLNRK